MKLVSVSDPANGTERTAHACLRTARGFGVAASTFAKHDAHAHLLGNPPCVNQCDSLWTGTMADAPGSSRASAQTPNVPSYASCPVSTVRALGLRVQILRHRMVRGGREELERASEARLERGA